MLENLTHTGTRNINGEFYYFYNVIDSKFTQKIKFKVKPESDEQISDSISEKDECDGILWALYFEYRNRNMCPFSPINKFYKFSWFTPETFRQTTFFNAYSAQLNRILPAPPVKKKIEPDINYYYGTTTTTNVTTNVSVENVITWPTGGSTSTWSWGPGSVMTLFRR